MQGGRGTMTNYDRLLNRLDKNSLAYELVLAHLKDETTCPDEAMKAVLQRRLELVRTILDKPKV